MTFQDEKKTASTVGQAVAAKNGAKKKNTNKNNKKEKKNKNKNNQAKKLVARPAQPRIRAALASRPAGPHAKALALVRRTFVPGVPRLSVHSKRVFDLRERSTRRNVALNVLRLFRGNAGAREEASKILAGDYADAAFLGGAVRLRALELVEPLSAAGYGDSAGAELIKPDHGPGHLPKKAMVRKIEEELLEDELQTNAVGQLYMDSLLNPCSAPNPGFPDEENRGLSMKLRVRTTMLLPMVNNEAYVVVSRNPARHVQIQAAGGSNIYWGPATRMRTLTAGKQSLLDEAGKELTKTDSYVEAGKTASIRCSAGYDRALEGDEFTNENVDTLDLMNTFVEGSAERAAKYLPAAAGDIVHLDAYTSDTTPGNYFVEIEYLTSVAGATPTIQKFTSLGQTGTGTTNSPSIIFNYALPANAIGVYSYGIRNAGTTGTTTVTPGLQMRLTLAASPLSYPIGSADLSDIGLLNDYADDLRVVGCRATVTYVAKKLEGGYIVGGQLPQSGDDDIPEGSLAALAVIPGMVPRPLNGVTPGISFPIFALNEEESDFKTLQSLYDDDTFSEGAIQIVTTGADADLIILQTEMSLQARTERQVLMATTGEVDLKAIADVQTYIARKGPLAFVTGNDDHEEVAAEAVRQYAAEHPTYQFFNGWFSGNSTSLKDVVV